MIPPPPPPPPPPQSKSGVGPSTRYPKVEGFSAPSSSASSMPDKIPVVAHYAPRFDISDQLQAVAMLEYLDVNGYAVVASVATNEQIQEADMAFWDFCENTSPELKRNDVQTWSDANWLAHPQTGILSCKHGFNHSDFMWNARLLPGVRKAFELVWGCEDLVVSYDGGNAFRPWKYDPTWTTDGGWWHVDQNSRRGPHRHGRVCIQGLVNFRNAGPDTGGLCVIPASHLQHDALCDRAPAARHGIDFVPVDASDPILQAGGVLVCAAAGDLILWDSRTVHCNTPALTWASHFDSAAAASSITTAQDVVASTVGTSLQSSEPACGGRDAARVKGTTNPIEPPAEIATAASGTARETSPAAGAQSDARAGTPEQFSQDADPTSSSPVTVQTGSAAAAASVPGAEESALIRLAAYVCMIPRSRLPPAKLAARRGALAMRAGSSHWPDAPPKPPQSSAGGAGRAAPAGGCRWWRADPEQCAAEVRRLV